MALVLCVELEEINLGLVFVSAVILFTIRFIIWKTTKIEMDIEKIIALIGLLPLVFCLFEFINQRVQRLISL